MRDIQRGALQTVRDHAWPPKALLASKAALPKHAVSFLMPMDDSDVAATETKLNLEAPRNGARRHCVNQPIIQSINPNSQSTPINKYKPKPNQVNQIKSIKSIRILKQMVKSQSRCINAKSNSN